MNGNNTPSGWNLGQTYMDCAALGTPGNASTYNLTMAQEAAAVSPYTDVVGTFTCNASGGTASQGIAAVNSTHTATAMWVYVGPLAGHVFVNIAGGSLTGGNATCPLPTDPTWD